MSAEFLDHADTPARIAKGDKLLRQQSHADGRTIGFRDLVSMHGREPIAAEELAHRRSRPRLGQKVILRLRRHRSSPRRLSNPTSIGWLFATAWAAPDGVRASQSRFPRT